MYKYVILRFNFSGSREITQCSICLTNDVHVHVCMICSLHKKLFLLSKVLTSLKTTCFLKPKSSMYFAILYQHRCAIVKQLYLFCRTCCTMYSILEDINYDCDKSRVTCLFIYCNQRYLLYVFMVLIITGSLNSEYCY